MERNLVWINNKHLQPTPNIQMLHMIALTQYIRKRKTPREKNQSNIDQLYKWPLESDVSADRSKNNKPMSMDA